MKYCDHCQVHLRGNRDVCPLCGNMLPEGSEGSLQEEICPVIPPSYESHLAVKIMVFISIVATVASFAVYIIFPTDINWPILVLLGILSMWVSLVVVIRKRHNMPKNIMWQVTIVSALSVVWDWKTGWRGWSLEFFIPIACVTAMLVMYVTAKIMKLSVRDYIAYALLNGLFGIIPGLFILLDWIKVYHASIACIALSIIFISAIFIFQGENIKAELKKRMHI
ncbi:hypothetical protein CDQ84_02470 [Clostridium thermosuccinogenes]|uniref:Zinc ribbon domain-containing protein n=1 Tax=Clostridium thermosuccinogenes TaxID=84032 RepID=A0A2K2FLF0_9CLOT|nr:DUF6320 domain-containing protein [Pseudoclostridium thermosuccinogenes]AUS96985.1 hypothetical protein CDO33_11390 [Pseudoclostridium thermosuccinogenes]PNT92341.1 hypothetical protein CDQ83_01825 [Pseudoclostridium thermosuccinogenes]PNT99598.1 hypothetical protein CDQ85_01865 [Pseudoclostridium thermosuccinogenes]PNU01268.1 hypothetical protein CDQ84_02470 [Pseudoclostridium thermosuccinogenes]